MATPRSSGKIVLMAERAPLLGDIEALAERALATIPRALKRHLGPLVIRVEEFPDEETEAAEENFAGTCSALPQAGKGPLLQWSMGYP